MAAAAEAHVHVEHPHRESFWTRYVFSQDHKVIGLQYLLTSLFMALVGGALAMVFRTQLAWPQSGVLKADQYLAEKLAFERTRLEAWFGA